jgi:ArsR family transcriptional regulator
MIENAQKDPGSGSSRRGCATTTTGGATAAAVVETQAAIRVAKALADPIRLRMLNMMAAGRAACCSPSLVAGSPPGDEPAEGICVCELQSLIGMAQSRASYHLRVLKDAGLVTETTRGKWNYYALDREALAGSLAQLAAAAGAPPVRSALVG